MYLLTLYGDTAHSTLISADRFPSVKRLAYYLGEQPSKIYNFIQQRAKSKGILKYVEINKIK